MQQTKLQGDTEDIICPKHQQQIITFSLEEKIKLDDRLCCRTCLEMIGNSFQTIPWSKAKQTFYKNYQQQLNQANEDREQLIQQGRQFKFLVDEFKTKLIKTLDEIVASTYLWMVSLEEIHKDNLRNDWVLEQIIKITDSELLSQSYNLKMEQLNQISKCHLDFQSQLKCSFMKILQLDSLPQLEEILTNIFNYRIEESKEDLLEQNDSELLILFEQFSNQVNTISQEMKKIINIRKNILETNQQILAQVKRVEQEIVKPITYSLINEIKQLELCSAIAFNNEGTIMAASCEEKIKIWQIVKGKLKNTGIVLTAHTCHVCCLVFSKKVNWFASSGWDKVIWSWKEKDCNNWVSSRSSTVHTDSVVCLLLNNNEDQLISCSADHSIKIWKADCHKNELTYNYSLDKHTGFVDCISLNESETLLVSCSHDKTIIIWAKGWFGKWQFRQYITKSIDDYGQRISFIGLNMIAWQQQSKGITHIFIMENGIFKEVPELQIVLNQSDGNNDICLFPSVYNKKRKILIQKHNQYVYILQQQNEGKFKVHSQPIDCNHYNNYGALTESGQHLVIWNYQAKKLRLYQICFD